MTISSSGDAESLADRHGERIMGRGLARDIGVGIDASRCHAGWVFGVLVGGPAGIACDVPIIAWNPAAILDSPSITSVGVHDES
jgi:hypothetical protein